MKKRSTLITIGIISYVLVLVGFIALSVVASKRNGRQILYEGLPTDSKERKSGEFNVSLQNTKNWIEGMKKFGGQFELEFINDTGFDIHDWEFVFTVVADAVIDSSWNGDFEILDNPEDPSTVLIKAKDSDLHPILPCDDTWYKIGCVIKSSTDTPILKVVATATRKQSITALPLFWILIFITVCLIFVTCLQLAIMYRTKQYQVQRVRDEAIVVQSINTFVNFIDAKDPYTKGHSTRVAAYSKELGDKMHLNEEDKKNLYFIALMHDVGKVSIPDAVLQKPGKLTPDERKIIESHTTVGGEMLHAFTAIPGIVSGALYHHERYDGTGYPQGLKGNQIPLFARIICVADSFDAMSSRRCYRTKLTYDEIVQELSVNSGKQFDPEICGIMLDILETAKNNGTLEKYNL